MATLSNEQIMPHNFLAANLNTARKVLDTIGTLAVSSDPTNQTNKECLAIAARFTDPTKFQDPFQKTQDPLRLALILRKVALERQAVDLVSLENDGVRQTKIIPFIKTANEISRLLTQDHIEADILERLAKPIYIDDSEFTELKVSLDKIAFLSKQETSLRRSLIIDTVTEIEKPLPPPATSAPSG